MLGDIDIVRIELELLTSNALPGETVGIDNVRLEAGRIEGRIPEPSLLVLLGLAGAVAGIQRLRSRKFGTGLPLPDEA